MSPATISRRPTDTSAGGIIALGLGVKRWSIAECQSKLILLSQRVFTRDSGLSASLARVTGGWSDTIVRAARVLWCDSIYDGKKLEAVIQDAFGKDDLLAARGFDDVKVAVTATTGSSPPCTIFTNYDKRQHPKERAYGWPDHELASRVCIWEA